MLSFLSIKYLQTVSLLHYLSACHVCYCFINLIKLTLCCNTVLQRMFFSFMSQYVHYHIHDLGVLMHACQDVKPAENTRSYYIKEKSPENSLSIQLAIGGNCVTSSGFIPSLSSGEMHSFNCSAAWLPYKKMKWCSLVSTEVDIFSQQLHRHLFFHTDTFRLFSRSLTRTQTKTIQRKHPVKTHPALHTLPAPSCNQSY